MNPTKENGERAGSARRGLMVAAEAGRGGDRVLGHLTPGELVVPKSCQTPELMALFARAAHAKGMDPNRYIVGSEEASRNPRTGLEEFLEGDSGGVGDTGEGGNSNGGDSSGGNASGHGGENAAHGETGNQTSGYGEAGPSHGFGDYSGPAAVAGNEDAVADRGLFSGYLSDMFEPPSGKTLGFVGTALGMVPGVGLAMAGAKALEALTGEKGVADYGDGTGGGDGLSDGFEYTPIRRRARRGLLPSRRA
jgi:hypothetical protein